MVEIAKTPYDGTPFYCVTCGAGPAEYNACEEVNCQLESIEAAQARRKSAEDIVEAAAQVRQNLYGEKLWTNIQEAIENSSWNYNMKDAPQDRTIIVSTNSVEGLPAFSTYCRWHPDAGFCVDELREVIAWRDFPPPAKEK